MSSPLQLTSIDTAAPRPLLLLKVALLVCTAAISSAAFAQVTTTSLAITSGGVAVTSAKAGRPVTLTATVKAGTAAVKQGQVNFCDATATHCTDIHILATAQLTSSGTATYTFRPGIGSHSYKAVFVGTDSYVSSTSRPGIGPLRNCRKAFRPKTKNTSPSSNLTISTTIFMPTSPVKFRSPWAQQKRASPRAKTPVC
jgi:Bacterial Ig-like domain (group 3)